MRFSPRQLPASVRIACMGIAAWSIPLSAISLGLEREGTGISELWFTQHGSSLNLTQDSDGDGVINRLEGIAGTDPFDSQSRLQVNALDLSSQAGTVNLKWPSILGKQYRVEASTDLIQWRPVATSWSGDGEELTASLPLASTYLASGSTLRRWTGVTESITQIRTFARNGSRLANATSEVSRLQTTQTSPDENNYAQQLRGWIVPPATGAYTFWISSDDVSELWLSTDATPANAVRLAWVDQWTSFQQWTTFPSQQSISVTLVAGRAYYFEVFHREYTGGDHLSVGWSGAALGTSTPAVIAAPHLVNSPDSLADLSSQGRVFYRIRVWDTDSDSDGVSDYEEGLLGLNPATATTTPRVQDRDQILGMLDAQNVVTVGVAAGRAYETGGDPAEFVIFRSGNLNPLTVSYTLEGTATPGADFIEPSGSVRFPLGKNRVTVPMIAKADAEIEPAESVVLRITPGTGFVVGSPDSASVSLDDAPDVLFVAQLQPASGVTSGGSGTFAVTRAGNSLFGRVSLAFSGLASASTGTELYVSANGETGPVVLSLPAGQIAPRIWNFEAAGGLTREQILQALDSGNLWVRVKSSGVPDGELRGSLGNSLGWQTMPAPPAPPAAPVIAANDAEAARFLSQATFGADSASITALRGGNFAAWIDNQIALPPTLHTPAYLSRRSELLASRNTDGWQGPRQQAWWQAALTAPDQLRQRMAFALSQIFVISQFGVLDSDHEGTSRYYDILVEGAFGNYRDLLKKVTLSPMMGAYLSMMRNRKPDPETGHEPDENYAREVMQLFSIGLNQLHPDGSLKLDAAGLPLPTYSQSDTVDLAHIFTGWGPHYDASAPPRWSGGSVAPMNDWFRWGSDPLREMSFYPAFHDQQNRTIVGGTEIAGTLTGPQRMDAALDALFHHPNTGPFVAKQLIQKFVTANPSPGYILRVSQKFANNGSGIRGDLGATLRAVLLDPEARSSAFLGNVGHGKPYEPVLRMARLMRLFRPIPPKAGDPRFFLNFQYSIPEQAPLLSPSVFNFFQPGYRQPGRIAAAGLLSPEFQLLGETTIISQSNVIYTTLTWGIWVDELIAPNDNYVVKLDLSEAVAILNASGKTRLAAQEDLIEFLNIRLLGGRMTAALKQNLRDGFLRLPAWYDYSDARQRERVTMATYLVLTSPEFAVQR